MYERYWELEGHPFDNGRDPRAWYPAPPHESALLKLRYLIERRKGAGLLTGDSGLGKSFLASQLADRLGESHGPMVHLVYPRMSPAELFAYLAVALGAAPDSVGSETGGMDRTIRAIEGELQRHETLGLHPVVLVDEAHLIDDVAVFQALRLLLNFQSDQGPLLSLILIGRQELGPRLSRLVEFDDRLAVKCPLRPLTAEETADYVACRLNAAGARRPLFDESALTALFEISAGNPRRINRLCDMALLVGFADEATMISAAQVSAVAEELATGMDPPGRPRTRSSQAA
ncbi:MAG: ExeA family protein [Planctomycetales bacterium]